MLDPISFKAFDSLANPMMICETDGRVIYKNTQASRTLQVPHLGRRVLGHFDRNGKAAFRNWRESMPAFLEYEFEGQTVTAFADTTVYENRTVILLFFSHLFNFSLIEPCKLFSPQEIAHYLSAGQLIRLATDAHLRENSDMLSETRSRHLRACRAFQQLFSSILCALHYNGEAVYQSLESAFQMIRYAADRILSPMGLTPTFPEIPEAFAAYTLDFKPFALLLSHILVMLTEISNPASATLSLHEEHHTLWVEIKAPIKDIKSQFTSNKTASLSHLLPGSSLDLYAFQALCDNQHYHFAYTIDTSTDPTLSLKLRVPVHTQTAVCEIHTEEFLLLYDLIHHFAASLTVEN